MCSFLSYIDIRGASRILLLLYFDMFLCTNGKFDSHRCYVLHQTFAITWIIIENNTTNQAYITFQAISNKAYFEYSLWIFDCELKITSGS